MPTQIQPKTSLTDDVHQQIAVVAETATPEDLATHERMVAKASEKTSEIATISPGLAALIFTKSNIHNRDWNAGKTLNFAKQMREGKWRWNGATFVWYEDGSLADAQHRAGGVALAGETIETIVVYGLKKSDIATVDAGRPRNAAQAASLEGILEAAKKSTILRSYLNYESKRLVKKSYPLSNAEMKDLIVEHDTALALALHLGQDSQRDIARPVLGDKSLDAAKIAFLMLTAPHAWPDDKVLQHLRALQLGRSSTGEHDPIFQVAELLSKDAEGRRREKMNETDKFGVALHAFKLVEGGVVSIQPRELRNMRKRLPAADFNEPMAEAAE